MQSITSMLSCCRATRDFAGPFLQVSTGLLRKFMGILDAPLSMREAAVAPDSVVCCRATSPLCIMAAMAKHRSQWVWYVTLHVYIICVTDA